AKHGNRIQDKSIYKLCCRQEIALVRRNDVPTRIAKRGITKILETFCALDAAWCRCPCVTAAALDRVQAHLVDVEEQAVLVPGSVIDHCAVRSYRIFNRLPEVPFLRPYRQRKIALRQGFFGDERNI